MIELAFRRASLAAIVAVGVRGVRVAGSFRRPALGVAEDNFPVRAARFMTQNEIQRNVFNTMELGGYLIWSWYPERKVFIDGRLDVYGHELFDLYAKTLRSEADLDAVVAKYDIGCFLLSQPL